MIRLVNGLIIAPEMSGRIQLLKSFNHETAQNPQKESNRSSPLVIPRRKRTVKLGRLQMRLHIKGTAPFGASMATFFPNSSIPSDVSKSLPSIEELTKNLPSNPSYDSSAIASI